MWWFSVNAAAVRADNPFDRLLEANRRRRSMRRLLTGDKVNGINSGETAERQCGSDGSRCRRQNESGRTVMSSSLWREDFAEWPTSWWSEN